MKALFLHGLSSDGSMKTGFIRSLGYDVMVPKLSDWSFKRALQSAQDALDQFDPNVIVGSSRGGAVAMSIEADTPLVLLAPAWRICGVKPELRTTSVVIHCPWDNMVSIFDSRELCERNRDSQLIEVGEDHRLNDDAARCALTAALASVLQ